jgi:GDP/UDP-N,N'-diacetylbacillosamine 2-epimerase (hydrolysing)
VRRICVVTGSRAEYGLLRWVMEGVRASDSMQLQLVVTGSHLSPEFGLTYREIEGDGFQIDRKVEMLLSSDTPVGIAKSMALATAGLGEAFEHLHPDLVVLLGDRYELLSAASAALVARVPIAHIHGGEASEGAIDDSIRHAITKMSHLHFVAASPYHDRVIQLGEDPSRVFTVGGLGVDAIARLPRLSRPDLAKSLDFTLGQRNLLVTFHPATLDTQSPEVQMGHLLSVLGELKDTHIVFTLPNADTNGRAVIRLIHEYVDTHKQTSRAYASLGQLRYLSCLSIFDAVVGNSSSGLIEAPTFQIPTVNIGTRQAGRLRSTSVIDCAPTRASIRDALGRAFSPEFQQLLKSAENPYGTGGASEAIVRVLETWPLEGLVNKRFYDIPLPSSATSTEHTTRGAT